MKSQKEETPACYLDKKDFTGMSQAEIKEQLAHEYAEKWPDHQYMPARQGFEAGYFAGKYLASKRETPVKPDFDALILELQYSATDSTGHEVKVVNAHEAKDLLERIWNDYVASKEVDKKVVTEMIAKVHEDIEGRYDLDAYDKGIIHSLLCKLQ